MAESTGNTRVGSGRVLVTGANGFTGVWLQRELESSGYEVIGTCIADAAAGQRVLDITSPADCVAIVDDVRPDYVIHLAAISFVQHADATDFHRVNVLGTRHLLDALVGAAVAPKKVLIASSANIYGNVGGVALTEEQPAAPANQYAASKLAMEQMAATYFDKLPIVMTRPFNYTGVGQSPSFLVPKIVSHFARGARTIELGNTEIARDFSDVRMVVDAYRRLVEAPVRGRTFNICTGVAVSLREIIAMIEEIAGYAIDVQVNPEFVRGNDVLQLTGDPRALIGAIGPIAAIPFRDTLTSMYEAMRTDEQARG